MTNPNPTPSTLGGEGQSQSRRDRQSSRPNPSLSESYHAAVHRIGKLGGFAVGAYITTCSKCGRTFDGDKRAFSCLPCAVDALVARASPQRPLPDEGMREKVVEKAIRLLEAVREMRRAEDRHRRIIGDRQLSEVTETSRDDCDLWLTRVYERGSVGGITRMINALALLPDQPPVRPGDREMVEGLLQEAAGYIGMNDVRLVAREGKLRQGEIMLAVNTILAARYKAIRLRLDLSSRPDEGRSVPEGWSKVREIVDLFFERWGASKSERWEALSGDLPFNADVAMDLIHDAMPAPYPPPYETGGEG